MLNRHRPVRERDLEKSLTQKSWMHAEPPECVKSAVPEIIRNPSEYSGPRGAVTCVTWNQLASAMRRPSDWSCCNEECEIPFATLQARLGNKLAVERMEIHGDHLNPDAGMNRAKTPDLFRQGLLKINKLSQSDSQRTQWGNLVSLRMMCGGSASADPENELQRPVMPGPQPRQTTSTDATGRRRCPECREDTCPKPLCRSDRNRPSMRLLKACGRSRRRSSPAVRHPP